jgi:hypothetical protein
MSKKISTMQKQQWIPEICKYSPIFYDLECVMTDEIIHKWPDCEKLMSYIKPELCSLSGIRITMHPQDKSLAYPEMSYEERIYKNGIISTREENWHDFFNAMIWALFPETKKLLNLLHIREMQHQLSSQRTQGRDGITHLDESGIIIASSQQRLLEQLKDHQWREVFYQQRELWNKNISAYIFGHGMYEKALNPFIGFTGKMYPLLVEEDFFHLDKVQQYKQLDIYLAEEINNTKSLIENKLSPFPILGVPGWYKDNQQESFYLNTAYFRPARQIIK